MFQSASPTVASAHPGMSFREFVAFIAALMAINALAIDIMLPALPAMADALGITVENQRQYIIAGYMFGFGVAQLVYGPLSDRFGRRPVLIGGMLVFVVMSVAAAFATDFATIVGARVLQGVCAAASRVLSVSIVRDCYSGRRMARVMSLTFVVFLAVPILAPSIGQLILLVAPWPVIFYFLAAFGLLVVGWGWLRLPETLPPERRRPVSPRAVFSAAREVATNRYALGYTLAASLMYGGLTGYINSVQQIFADVFAAPDLFPMVFAATAGTMAIGSFFNSQIVERLGTRRVSHTALIAFIAISAVHAAVAAAGFETMLIFALFLAAAMGCFSLASSNFNAMAMEPVGHIAGTAASVQGFMSTIGGTLLGLVIGQSFNGTTLPVVLGFLLLGLASIGTVLIVERGKLFRPQHGGERRPAQ